MVRNASYLEKFYRALDSKEKLSYSKAAALYEALHEEALSLRILNSKNILDGLEADLRMARILNQLR